MKSFITSFLGTLSALALVAILAFSNPSKEDYVNRCMLSKVKKPTTNLVEYAKDAIVTAVAKKALESLIERTDFIVLSIYKNHVNSVKTETPF